MTNITSEQFREMTDEQLVLHLRKFPYKSQYKNPTAYGFAEYRLSLMQGARYMQTGSLFAFRGQIVGNDAENHAAENGFEPVCGFFHIFNFKKMELLVGSKVELGTGDEGVVQTIEAQIVYVRLDNGDLFRYTLDGIHMVGGGECNNASDYDFYNGSMDIRRIISA